MTTAGTWYYPPSAGTGGFLAHLANPPFSMDNTRTPSDEWVEKQFYRWGVNGPETLEQAFVRIHEAGWDACKRAARRPKPPTLRQQALASTTAILADSSIIIPDAVRDALTLSQQALIDEDNLDGN